jgi:hypothetical protein
MRRQLVDMCHQVRTNQYDQVSKWLSCKEVSLRNDDLVDVVDSVAAGVGVLAPSHTVRSTQPQHRCPGLYAEGPTQDDTDFVAGRRCDACPHIRQCDTCIGILSTSCSTQCHWPSHSVPQLCVGRPCTNLSGTLSGVSVCCFMSYYRSFRGTCPNDQVRRGVHCPTGGQLL